MAIEAVVTAPRSPWQNAYVERIIGSIRRESTYFEYHHQSRTHLSLGKDCPVPRPIQPPSAVTIVALPWVGGLHHRYERRAARTVCGNPTCTAVAAPVVVAVRYFVARRETRPELMQGGHAACGALLYHRTSSTMDFVGKPS